MSIQTSLWWIEKSCSCMWRIWGTFCTTVINVLCLDSSYIAICYYSQAEYLAFMFFLLIIIYG